MEVKRNGSQPSTMCRGGFLLHAPLATAETTVPNHSLITGASAWYISPG
jgi:hypothetical protein